MALLDQIGCEGYPTRADITSKTQFTTGYNLVTNTNIDALHIANESWYTGGATGGTLRRAINFPLPASGEQNELEFHLAYHFTQSTGISSSYPLASIGIQGSTLNASTIGVEFILIQLPNDPSNYGIAIRFSDASTITLFPTPHAVFTGSTFYLVLRLISESDARGDGKMEAWINGDRVAFVENITYNKSIQNAQFSGITSYFLAGVPTSNTNTANYRNFQAYNGLTTPFGTQPPTSHVADLVPSSFNALSGSWTIEGGAATEVDAITDGNSATYVQTVDSGAEAIIGFDRPAEFSGLNSNAAIIRGDFTRLSSNLNTITVSSVDDANGTNTIDSFDTTISTITPATQPVVDALSINSADLFIKITNGS